MKVPIFKKGKKYDENSGKNSDNMNYNVDSKNTIKFVSKLFILIALMVSVLLGIIIQNSEIVSSVQELARTSETYTSNSEEVEEETQEMTTAIIKKTDSETGEPLPDASFNLTLKVNDAEVIGSFVENSIIYRRCYFYEGDTESLKDEAFGELTNNGTYYFVQDEEGSFIPINSKTYQDNTEGIQDSIANSYIRIDLTNYEGEYAIVANASVSSDIHDYGFATITESEEAPQYSDTNGRFIYMSGTLDSADYASSLLTGGKVYYLHLGYYKNSDTDIDDDQIKFNSIKLYKTSTLKYYFEGKTEQTENGEEKTIHVSNNNGKDNTLATSYVKIDLTKYIGEYNLVVNAEISSELNDYGYATISSSKKAPAYDDEEGRFIFISGEQSAKDYTTVLEGGKVYYLHFGYYKNDSISSGDDVFTINSVNIGIRSWWRIFDNSYNR